MDAECAVILQTITVSDALQNPSWKSHWKKESRRNNKECNLCSKCRHKWLHCKLLPGTKQINTVHSTSIWELLNQIHVQLHQGLPLILSSSLYIQIKIHRYVNELLLLNCCRQCIGSAGAGSRSLALRRWAACRLWEHWLALMDNASINITMSQNLSTRR